MLSKGRFPPRDRYNVTVLPQGKKLGKQLGQLEAAGFVGAAFMDKDESEDLCTAVISRIAAKSPGAVSPNGTADFFVSCLLLAADQMAVLVPRLKAASMHSRAMPCGRLSICLR